MEYVIYFGEPEWLYLENVSNICFIGNYKGLKDCKNLFHITVMSFLDDTTDVSSWFENCNNIHNCTFIKAFEKKDKDKLYKIFKIAKSLLGGR